MGWIRSKPIFPYNFYKAKIACQKMTRTKKAVARWGSHAATALLSCYFSYSCQNQ